MIKRDLACADNGVTRNINMWTLSQHTYEDGCKPRTVAFIDPMAYWTVKNR